MFSFHATKLFHTAEGGAIACGDPALRQRIDRLKNFGIADQETVESVGLNGKMNELQAALGLAVLDCMADELSKRRRDPRRLSTSGSGQCPGFRFMPERRRRREQLPVPARSASTRAAFGRSRDEVHAELKTHNVFTRKYFYPLCSDYPATARCRRQIADGLPVARTAVDEVLCLPLYGTLPLSAVDTICDIVVSSRCSV